MGQKVNPHGLRVGVIKDWDSRWFANKKDFGINEWFLPFTAGAIIIAIPITLLFIFMQKYYVEGVTGGSVK